VANNDTRYFGVNIAALGPFFEKDVNQTNHPDANSIVRGGWPLDTSRQTFATISGFYDRQPNTTRSNYPELLELGDESVISGIPYPLGLHLIVGNEILNSTTANTTAANGTFSNFSQTYSFQDGTVNWGFTWMPKNTNVRFDIKYLTFTSRVRPNVGATQLRVTPRGGDYNASIVDFLDGRSAVRSFLGEKGGDHTSSSIYVSNHPNGLPDVEAWTWSTANFTNGYTDMSSRKLTTLPNDDNDNEMSIGQKWEVHLKDGETAVFQKFVGVASSDGFQDPKTVAENAMLAASQDGWDKLLSEHTEAWNKLMERNLMSNYRDPATGQLPENDTITEALQISETANRYYQMQNLLPEGSRLNDDAIAVGGLTSDSYAGLRFWDGDRWMYPGIAITNPSYARQFLNFRVKQFEQAKANAQIPYVQGKYKFDSKSVLYPWTSGRYGNATGTGPALDYEYHLNPDIALAMFQDLAITGDKKHFEEKYWPVVEGVGHTIATLLTPDGNGWSIRNMTDPDEYAVSSPCSFCCHNTCSCHLYHFHCQSITNTCL